MRSEMGPRLDATCDAALLMVQGRRFEDRCDDARWSGGVSRRAQRTRTNSEKNIAVWEPPTGTSVGTDLLSAESARASETTAGVKDTLTF